MSSIARDKGAALISITVTIFLVILKYSIGVLSGSIALVADSIHALTDVLSSVAVLLGLMIASRKPTKSFPYGFYKAENVASLLLALAIWYAGYEIVRTSLGQVGGAALTHLPAAIATALASVLVTFLLSRYKLKVGRELGSPSLIADGKHTQADLYASTAVLIGLVGYALGFSYFDPLAGLIVSLFVFRAGYGILQEAIKVLLDASIGLEELEKIREVVLAVPGVQRLHALKARSSGKFLFIELTIRTHLKDLEAAHHLSEKIEAAIKASLEHVDRVVVQLEPEAKDILRYAVPCTTREGVNAQVSAHFGEAEYFCLFDLRTADHEVLDLRFITNPFRHLEKGKGLRAAELLVDQKIDKVFTREPLAQKSPSYVLRNAYVDFDVTAAETVGAIITQLSTGDR
jgi:cation diffusion facilitator family transporter